MKDLKVFIAHREVQCAECGEQLGRHAWITLDSQKGPVCLACADLEHLAYLPAGNTALTRRARKNSRLSAVVLKWARARKQYGRQGVLVEEGPLQQAEAECAADEAVRVAARVRAAERRAELDEKYIESFAHRIRDMYPGAPTGREMAIAVHACQFIYISNQLNIPWLNLVGNHDDTIFGNYNPRLGYGRDPDVNFYPVDE